MYSLQFSKSSMKPTNDHNTIASINKAIGTAATRVKQSLGLSFWNQNKEAKELAKAA